MVKVLGSEIKKCFYAINDTLKFPGGDLFFEEYPDFDEIDDLDDSQKYELSDLGYWYNDKTEKSFNSVYSAWKKAATSVDLLITVPKEKELEIKQLLLGNGVKIIK
jgi:hypothetical protein